MKPQQTKRITRGSAKPGKTITKKEAYEFDGECVPSSPKGNKAMTSKRLTRSQAATIQKSLIRIPDIALKLKKGADTKGGTSNTLKLTCARRYVETNDGVSTNRGKEPAKESTDENAPHERNQDKYLLSESSSRYPTTLSHLARLVACEEPKKSTIPSSTVVAKETNEATEAQSFHLTEMIAMMNDGASDDDEEEESSVDQTLVSVGAYRVKIEIAPLLEKIMDRHKDIAKECKIKNLKSQVPHLEVICSICQKLENSVLKDVMDTELEDMLISVEGIQHMGFDVKWLLERLKDLSEMKRLLKDYPAAKERKAKLEIQLKEISMLKRLHDMELKEIDMLEQQLNMKLKGRDMLKQQLSAAEADFSAKKMEVEKAYHDFKQQINDMKPKGLALRDKSLIYGLI